MMIFGNSFKIFQKISLRFVLRGCLFFLLVIFFASGCVRTFLPDSNQTGSGNANVVANTNNAAANTNATVVCLTDVRQCPDGSFVPRLPPTCAFAPCPE
ncbi:MAG: hypothetical protein A3B74_03650 [Candidatus Kerfeldbacteria bacterium RIFCSPHIGHO2_02_FULL_42_14]|uniref:Uncharacterized protein n=1 Tax=Candidatus Kerfeldbacteria bacterium RIFCSPHIGHO2_02_FULL_42_14 TaxID=1798540 RepID=A0A1G2AQZ2_9BACT|nr:MAG: hypothetical protein A3B74_03650 [Candidatus Kerfeldbacteria bacterium RIFCSPHIGHO2_02_FULL_42_14]OGY82536.1 MAG: hypothetical protein A3I91_03810 [Candidatus Kerfeldbacteria bacterium RIFCSPLOWO2_02_FULL_42_19]OGY87541.1 MAG: hypothetical protein A3G01_00785 [Candidatus Kerfeldbacteria bacterium RIFCSPLOWO2_12_FULL_43_9]